MSKRPILISVFASAALAIGALPSAGQDAVQIVETELPPVVVEGATLEAKPVAKPKLKPKPVPVAVEKPAPEPAAPAPKKKAAKAKSAAAKPASPKPAAKPAPQPEFEPEPAAGGGEIAGNTGANASDNAASGITGVPADKIGGAVSVVTGAELKSRQVRNAADALRSLPGVAASQQGGAQGVTVVRLRCGKQSHVALIDGVETNAGAMASSISRRCSSSDIRQIEVLRTSSPLIVRARSAASSTSSRAAEGPADIPGRARKAVRFC